MLQGLAVDVKLAGDINAAIGEDGKVRDSASEEVRRTRGKVMTIEGRIRGVLKNQGGEVTEQVWLLGRHKCRMRVNFALRQVRQLPI